jgi:monofunctional biosynthetic peptidoglycan transglycosylase
MIWRELWAGTLTACVGIVLVAHLTWGDTVIDFAFEPEIWPSIDDRVMGGVSASSMTVGDGFATFRGEVSFDNNGGFASVRSRPQLRDFSASDGLILKVRGDGKRYGFRIRTSASFDGVSYQATIQPPAGEWHEVSIAFDEMVPVYRGRVVADHPPLDPALVTTFGFIIARQKGPFRLDIATIRPYRDEAQ